MLFKLYAYNFTLFNYPLKFASEEHLTTQASSNDIIRLKRKLTSNAQIAYGQKNKKSNGEKVEDGT